MPAVDWAAAATRAGNAILAVNPRSADRGGGCGKAKHAAGTTWWGGGLADVAAHPVTLAVPNQLVYSPHDYPASIFAQTWFADPTYPANLAAVWDRNWGYIAEQGIAPVLLGEFGTKLANPVGRGLAGHPGRLPRRAAAEFRLLVVQPEQRRHRRSGRRRLADTAAGQARRAGPHPHRNTTSGPDTPTSAQRRPPPRPVTRRRRRHRGWLRPPGGARPPPGNCNRPGRTGMSRNWWSARRPGLSTGGR